MVLEGLIKRLGTIRGQQWSIAQHAQVGFQDGSPRVLVVNDEDDGSYHIDRSLTDLLWLGE